MDKDLLKKKLHEQIDKIDDEKILQQLQAMAMEYDKTAGAENDLKPGEAIGNNEAVQEPGNADWISHDDLMELAKSWPKQP